MSSDKGVNESVFEQSLKLKRKSRKVEIMDHFRTIYCLQSFIKLLTRKDGKSKTDVMVHLLIIDPPVPLGSFKVFELIPVHFGSHRRH